MDRNLLGILYSLLYITVVLAFATFVSEKYKVDPEISRKSVHILSGNWIFISHYYFDSFFYAVSVPILFIIINYFSAKYRLIKVIERGNTGVAQTYGTVYYSIATLILILMDYAFHQTYISYMGMLIMAYGDGFAAILGLRFGTHFWIFKRKTLAGCLTLFTFAFVISNSVLYWHFYHFKAIEALLISILAVIIEFNSDDGIDNITLPVGVGIYTYFIIAFPVNTIIATVINALISYIAFKRRSLTKSGVFLAFFTGVIIYALGEVPMYISLLLFFVIGSAFSKVKNMRKTEAERLHKRGMNRNWVQVFANSAPAVAVLLISHIYRLPMKYAYLSGIACMSAACSDTFASELGMLSNKNPISIVSWKPVKRGLSGGVTSYGMIAAVVGSHIVASTVFLYEGYHSHDFLLVGGFGFLSNVLDSILGALLQVKYRAPDGSITEVPMIDGVSLPKVSGIRFISNDVVNLLSVSIVTFLMYYLAYLFID